MLLGLGATVLYVGPMYYTSWFRKVFGPLLRPEELQGRRLPGAFYFLIGTALTAAIVSDIHVARYAVECLALADPMASYIGSTIRSPPICQGSSLSGCLACFVTAYGVGFLMLPSTLIGTNSFILGLGALTCTLAEALPFGNDNLNIPLLTGIVVDRWIQL